MTGYLIRVAALDTDRGLPFIFAEKNSLKSSTRFRLHSELM